MNNLFELISKNMYVEVFRELDKITSSNQNTKGELTLLKSRFSEINKQKRSGIFEYSEFLRYISQLNSDLIDFTNSLSGASDPLMREYYSHLKELFFEKDLFNNYISLSQLYVEPKFKVARSAFSSNSPNKGGGSEFVEINDSLTNLFFFNY